MLLAVGALLLAAFAAIYALPHLLRRRAESELRDIARERRALVLTYDDGPGETLTPRLLEVLARHGARATFYALGRRAERAPEVLGRVQSAGHEIGCHSAEHLNAWKSPHRAVEDIRKGYGALARWVADDAIFRPPHGKLVLPALLALWSRGAPIGWWTHVSGDTWAKLPDPAVVVDDVLTSGGGVVLMHDFDRGPERADFVVELPSRLLEAARRDGLAVLTQGELLAGASAEGRS